MLTVTICATSSYAYAMRSQAYRVVKNLEVYRGAKAILIVNDGSPTLAQVVEFYRAIAPNCRVENIVVKDLKEGEKSYSQGAQTIIAKMRQAAFDRARALKSNFCWSLDSDVIPPDNALRCMIGMLAFDDGYYSVSTCPYANKSFLGGFGTPENHILPDYLPKERKLPDDLKSELEANDAELKRFNESKTAPTDEAKARWAETSAKIDKCDPDGTLWEVIAKYGWRRRGWMETCYPGIGLGSVVPIDWCGFGCTLMNYHALALANFKDYTAQGTEDLFICWKRWHPAGLRINAITHCVCDHIIWAKKSDETSDEYTLYKAYHEPDGECRGHLRTKQIPWTPETW